MFGRKEDTTKKVTLLFLKRWAQQKADVRSQWCVCAKIIINGASSAFWS